MTEAGAAAEDAYANALVYARTEIARLRNEPVDLFGCHILMLDPEGGRGFAAHLLGQQARHGAHGLKRTLSDAVERRWDLADVALRKLIRQLELEGSQLPAELVWYRDMIADGWIAKRKGRQRAPLAMRDIALAIILTHLVEEFRLLPTETESGAYGRSACSALAAAWQAEKMPSLGYDRMEGIWNRWGRGILSIEAAARLAT
jgi:hypothetical protein